MVGCASVSFESFPFGGCGGGGGSEAAARRRGGRAERHLRACAHGPRPSSSTACTAVTASDGGGMAAGRGGDWRPTAAAAAAQKKQHTTSRHARARARLTRCAGESARCVVPSPPCPAHLIAYVARGRLRCQCRDPASPYRAVWGWAGRPRSQWSEPLRQLCARAHGEETLRGWSD